MCFYGNKVKYILLFLWLFFPGPWTSEPGFTIVECSVELNNSRTMFFFFSFFWSEIIRLGQFKWTQSTIANAYSKQYKSTLFIWLYYCLYYMSNKYLPILYSKLLHEMGHYFLDTRYVYVGPEICTSYWVISYIFFFALRCILYIISLFHLIRS